MDDPAYQDFLLQRYEERIEIAFTTRYRVSKFCMDAGFLSELLKLDSISWLKTLENNFMQWLVVNTLFQEMMDHHNQKDGSGEAHENWTRAGSNDQLLVWSTKGVEIRTWSLSEDSTHSWVWISHGSNKYVMDSNNNDTEVPEDLLEEQALQLKVKDFACRSKAKAKPQRRELVDYSPSIIPMNERNWIDIEPGNYSL